MSFIGHPDGHAALLSDGSYRLDGEPTGTFWWVSGFCRFEPGEIDGYQGIDRIEGG